MHRSWRFGGVNKVPERIPASKGAAPRRRKCRKKGEATEHGARGHLPKAKGGTTMRQVPGPVQATGRRGRRGRRLGRERPHLACDQPASAGTAWPARRANRVPEGRQG